MPGGVREIKQVACAPHLILESDASMLSWKQGYRIRGLWTRSERNLHINVLEMMAGAFAIKTLAKDQSNIHIHLQMANTSAVAYVNHMWGGGGHITPVVRGSQGPVDTVLGQGNYPICRTPSWRSEHHPPQNHHAQQSVS